MKIWQKQIKIGNIGKYIKKNGLKWLVFLIVPLVIGLILHFAVPVTIVLNANPAAQKQYNYQKIDLQQKTARSISVLNAKIIQTNMQRYQNIRNFLIRIFGQQSPYIKIIPTKIIINSAYQFANLVNNGTDVSNISSRSMWYAQGKASFNDLNPVQQFVYGQYLAVQAFIEAQFVNINNSTQQSILKGISLSANFGGQDIHFQYPSKFKSEYLNLSTSSYDKYYNSTMYNYYNSNKSYEYMIFSEMVDNQNQLVICNVVFAYDQSIGDYPAGVACFHVTLLDIALKLTQNLGISNITYSTSTYYLLTPIYPSFGLFGANNSPQIIFNFTDKTSSQINFPSNQYYQLPSSLKPSLYIPNSGNTSVNYSFYISFQSSTEIYIQVPINIASYQQKQQTIMFLLVKYEFQSSVFNSIAKYSQILKDLSIPSAIVIFVSTIISLIVVKCLLNNLDNQIFKINDKCDFLINGDLDLKIQDYQNTQELKSVYNGMRIINSLHKFCTPQYFNQTEQKKIIKFYSVLQLFEQLKYPTDLVQQNLADSYFGMGQISKAIQFIQKSYFNLVKEIQQVLQCEFTQLLASKNKQNKRLPRSYKIKLIGRLFKILLMYNFLIIPYPIISFDKKKILLQQSQFDKSKKQIMKKYQKIFRKHLSVFKKLVYPNFITSQTLFVYLIQARLQLLNKNFKSAKVILKRFQKIMSQYGNQIQTYENNLKDDSPLKTYQQMKNNLSSYCRVTPEILWNAYYFLNSFVQNQKQQKQIVQKILNLKKSTNSYIFSEDVQLFALYQMIKMAYSFNIQKQKVQKHFSTFIFFKQLFPLYHLKNKSNYQQNQRLVPVSKIKVGNQRQIVFIYDCSNKWITKLQSFRQWQRQTRQISSKIFNFLLPKDRISIIKTNSTVYIQTCCNLTFKHHNQNLILKQLSNAIKLKFMSGKCKIIKALQVAIKRLKNLQEQKYVIAFLKQEKQRPEFQEKQSDKLLKKKNGSSNQLLTQMKFNNFSNSKKHRKNTQASPIHKKSIHSKAQSNMNSFQEQQQFEQANNNSSSDDYYKNLKHDILRLLLMPQLYNLKLILVIQNSQMFKTKFQLKEINEILHQTFLSRDIYNNNQFYVLQIQNQEQYERIFSKKTIKREQNNFINMF